MRLSVSASRERELVKRKREVIAKLALNQEFNGQQLGVCINDCEVDYGQPHSELSTTCFQLGCAFASMRWGTQEAASLPKLVTLQKTEVQIIQNLISA